MKLNKSLIDWLKLFQIHEKKLRCTTVGSPHWDRSTTDIQQMALVGCLLVHMKTSISSAQALHSTKAQSDFFVKIHTFLKSSYNVKIGVNGFCFTNCPFKPLQQSRLNTLAISSDKTFFYSKNLFLYEETTKATHFMVLHLPQAVTRFFMVLA